MSHKRMTLGDLIDAVTTKHLSWTCNRYLFPTVYQKDNRYFVVSCYFGSKYAILRYAVEEITEDGLVTRHDNLKAWGHAKQHLHHIAGYPELAVNADRDRRDLIAAVENVRSMLSQTEPDIDAARLACDTILGQVT